MWLPESTRSELARDQKAIAEMTLIDEACKHFTAELRQIDPDLELVKASNNANVPGLLPGYWHILHKGPPVDLHALQGPNGEFREPGSWMYQWLLEQDGWNDRTKKINRERAEKAESAKQRELNREREDRIEEMNERWYHATHESISFSPTKRPWAARAGARRAS